MNLYDLRELADRADREARERIELRRYLRNLLRWIRKQCARLRRELAVEDVDG